MVDVLELKLDVARYIDSHDCCSLSDVVGFLLSDIRSGASNDLYQALFTHLDLFLQALSFNRQGMLSVYIHVCKVNLEVSVA